ncbi:hypothetical protein H072_4456, partial [Dactylellina haptotyla CBS 200.50]
MKFSTLSAIFFATSAFAAPLAGPQNTEALQRRDGNKDSTGWSGRFVSGKTLDFFENLQKEHDAAAAAKADAQKRDGNENS